MLFSEPKIPQCVTLHVFDGDNRVSVLFSEPKIPQFGKAYHIKRWLLGRFSALQRAENSSIVLLSLIGRSFQVVSVLFSEPKIPQFPDVKQVFVWRKVSVLFSEPKIPQSITKSGIRIIIKCFSALQRAENSSISVPVNVRNVNSRVSVLFSEPKIPQLRDALSIFPARASFSALQRAENSSMETYYRTTYPYYQFQCSSASRKFLNDEFGAVCARHSTPFQCSSASRKFLNAGFRRDLQDARTVSVLFSEPKIPQSGAPATCGRNCGVSVLFSEPKIPQFKQGHPFRVSITRVSVLFSEPKIPQSSLRRCRRRPASVVSVLFSEPKIPQCCAPQVHITAVSNVSVLFSEPKIPQSRRQKRFHFWKRRFSALQRAENSSIVTTIQPVTEFGSFSALQRAENSSMLNWSLNSEIIRCFSALQRAENSSITPSIGISGIKPPCFSALQRAENSSMAHCAR